MKIIIERDGAEYSLSLGTHDWDTYEVLGMLEQAKHIVLKHIDELNGKVKVEPK